MNRKNILLIICVICLTFPLKLNGFHIDGDTMVHKYTIQKIQEQPNFYIIYARESNKSYKILSRKTNENQSSKRHKIQIGKSYPLSIKTLFLRGKINGIKLMPPGPGNNVIVYCNEIVTLETYAGIWDIYEAQNMNGIYLRKPPKYKVHSIEEHPSFYVLYAERNDTIIKIISKKTNNKKGKKRHIRVQRKYPFDLQSLFPKEYNENQELVSVDYSSPCIEYCGDTIYVEPEKGIKDIFIARNLDGLYLEDYY